MSTRHRSLHHSLNRSLNRFPNRAPLRSARDRAIVLLLCAALAGLAAACRPQPRIEIVSPLHGSFGAPVGVEAEVTNPPPGGMAVRFNGVGAAFDPLSGHWVLPWGALGFPPDLVFHTVLAEVVHLGSNRVVARDRVAIHNLAEYTAMPWPEGDRVNDGVLARLNEPGFEDLSDLVSVLATEELRRFVDGGIPADLLVPEQPEVDVDLPVSICVSATADGVPDIAGIEAFGTPTDVCIDHVSLDVTLTALPRDVDVQTSPGAGEVIADVGVQELALESSVTLGGHIALLDFAGLSIELPLSDFDLTACTADVSATDAAGLVRVALEPSPNGRRVDARQSADAVILLGGLDVQLGGLLCGVPGLNIVVNELEAPLTDWIENVLERALNDVDPGTGRTVLSDLLRDVTEDFEMLPVLMTDPARGTTIGALAEIQAISEGNDAVETLLDVQVRAQPVDPAAPAQTESFLAAGALPLLQPETPQGADYDLSATVSTGLMNQALLAAMRAGYFQHTEPEASIDFTAMGLCLPDPTAAGACLNGPQDLLAVLAALGVPAAALPTSPLELRLRPTVAPVVAMPDGPADPHWLHLHVSQYLAEIVEPGAGPGGGDRVWFQVAADAKAPVTFEAGAQPGTMTVTVGVETEAALLLEQHLTRVFPPDAAVAALAGYVMSAYVSPTVQATLGAIDLPRIDDPALEPDSAFEWVPVEAGLTYNHVTVFGNLEP